MCVFSFHLADCGVFTIVSAVVRPPKAGTIPGLLHAECMIPMMLGRPIALPARYRPRQLVLFARWESAAAIDDFLAASPLGTEIARGWHVRMEFLRRWRHVSELAELPTVALDHDEQSPVIAITLARLKLSESLRFIRWGKPVEEQVRDDPATTISLAAMRPLRTLSTFSIWKTQKAMTDMVHGRSDGPLISHRRTISARCCRNKTMSS